MKQLIMLKLADNDISDISALSGFVNLKELELGSNNITDINPLKDSYGITSLKLNDNQISDISALSQYGSLNKLELQNNNISDIEPLRLFLTAAVHDMTILLTLMIIWIICGKHCFTATGLLKVHIKALWHQVF